IARLIGSLPHVAVSGVGEYPVRGEGARPEGRQGTHRRRRGLSGFLPHVAVSGVGEYPVRGEGARPEGPQGTHGWQPGSFSRPPCRGRSRGTKAGYSPGWRPVVRGPVVGAWYWPIQVSSH